MKEISRRTLGMLAAAILFAGSAGAAESESGMNRVAETYVKLVLAMGVHDADYVDAYYGPPEWRAAATAAKRPLAEIQKDAEAALAALATLRPAAGAEEMILLRHEYLTRQLSALLSRIGMLAGRKMTFDEESKALYDAVAPTHPDSYFKGLTAELERALPGPGPLVQRYTAFREQFFVPKEKVDAVFQAAIGECRRRTQKQIPLPPGEAFVVEYVKGKSWSAYNWYKGNYQSLIQVNTDLPLTIDRALDLACHEGYPGHHVYNVLLEKNLVRDRGFQEFTVYPLFSPQSLIAEGTANYGIEVAFPGAERVAFERDVLFPLAGLDPKRAAEFRRVSSLAAGLAYAGNEAARRYLEGRIDKAGAQSWLEAYGLSAPAQAQQRIKFFDQYRSYVINYNLGQDLVRAYVESRGGTADKPERRWEEFKALLASPRLPGGLRPTAVK